MYIDVAISRYRFRVIVDFASLSRRRDGCYIARISLSRITLLFRVTLSSLIIIIVLIISKNSLTAVIFF